MTDNEIIKALECCVADANGFRHCKDIGCPFWGLCQKDFNALEKATLDLINRQKTEIDILIRKKEKLRDEITEQQAEIERLKSDLAFREKQLDRLVEEMEEEKC